MRPERFVITDTIWQLIEPLLPGTLRSRGVTAKDKRLFLEAVLWKVHKGGPWRDLPPGFGHGTACSDAFALGLKPMFSNVFSRRYQAIPTLNMFWSTAGLSAFTRKRATACRSVHPA